MMQEKLPHTARPTSRFADLQARALLRRPGNLALLSQCLLFLSVLVVTWLFLFEVVSVLLTYLLDPSMPMQAILAAELFYQLLRFAALLLLIAPILLGALRVVGLLATQRSASPTALFYYLMTPARYRRALAVVGVCSLFLLVVGGFTFGAVQGSLVLHRLVLWPWFSDEVAALLLVLCIVVSVLLGGLFFALLCPLLSVAALSVGSGALPVRRAVRLSMRGGNAARLAWLGFTVRTAWYLFLSVLTLGIGFVLVFAHRISLSYMRLSMALCPKGESL